MSSSTCTSIGEFRSAVKAVTDQFTDLCSKWRDIQGKETIPEEINGDVNVAIGQAELLKKERFAQFIGLIDNCEFRRGEKETTLQDLQGFWDIVYFQVEDILQKFKNLEKLQKNKWVKEVPKVVFSKPKLPSKKPHAVTRPTISNASKAKSASAIRAHILAARSKLQNQQATSQKSESIVEATKSVKSPLINSSEVNNANKENESVDELVLSTADLKVSSLNDVSTAQVKPLEPHNQKTTSKLTLSVPTIITNSKDEDHVKTPTQTDVTTFDAGFFKIETPSKKRFGLSKLPVTPNKPIALSEAVTPETRVLSSSVLKERVRLTPRHHKDYSPCMRITRSMKKMNATRPNFNDSENML